MLGGIIAWEYQDSELLGEHFLTVASYNLQHPAQFTDAALAGLRAVFIERLDHGLAIAEIRRRDGAAAQAQHACSSRKTRASPCCASRR
jgi:hypothetical protein